MSPFDTIEPVIAPGGESLGSLRLRHEATHEIILVPTPSQDPADPLNWFVEFLTFNDRNLRL